jgi:hypothetical protein
MSATVSLMSVTASPTNATGWLATRTDPDVLKRAWRARKAMAQGDSEGPEA